VYLLFVFTIVVAGGWYNRVGMNVPVLPYVILEDEELSLVVVVTGVSSTVYVEKLETLKMSVPPV